MSLCDLAERVMQTTGYDLKANSPQIFTMLALMALITTFLTNTALNLINRT